MHLWAQNQSERQTGLTRGRQPGIIKVFQQIWGTEDLIASFDGMNASLPINEKTGRKDMTPTKAWPRKSPHLHPASEIVGLTDRPTDIDQNPRKINQFELYQGIANLAPNGPDDGGLCVLKGSHLMHDQHFKDIGGFRPEGDAGEKENGYTLGEGEDEWYKQHGCEAVKICAGKGDLIRKSRLSFRARKPQGIPLTAGTVWDSRTVHWNASPVGEQTRFVTYVCYCPKSMASEETLQGKKAVFDGRKGTTHWPVSTTSSFSSAPSKQSTADAATRT